MSLFKTHDQLAVKADKLTRRFGTFTAVDSLNLEVNRGEIFGFLGANGAGKTTAIRMLCGLLRPTEGEAWIEGIPVSKSAERIKKHIGYMSQKFSLYNDLKVWENLEFYGGIYGLSRALIKSSTAEMLDKLQLAEYRDTMTVELPLGFKQRLALGCSILHNPGILFLDEPTSGVDPIARRKFWDLIYGLAEAGTTIFVTTHYMDEAEYCSRVSIMVQGKIVALETPGELKKQQDVNTMQDAFLRLVG